MSAQPPVKPVTPAPVLPAAVQRQVDIANDMMAKIYPPAPEGEPKPGELASQAGDASPTPPAPPAPPDTGWEQKYRVLQGKYDAEVPRLAHQITDLNRQLDALRDENRQLKETPKPPAPATKKVTAEEIEEFGPELVDLIGRRAEELYEPVVQSLRQEVETLKQQLGNVSTQTAQATRSLLVDSLRAAVPEYLQINQSPDFIQWLDVTDELAGVARGVMLRQAFEANDAQRVIAFFSRFKREHASATAGNGGSPAPTAPRTPEFTMQQQVAPGTTAASFPSTTGAQGQRRWTPADIQMFYADVARGKYRTNPAEQRRIELEILSATSGRKAS